MVIEIVSPAQRQRFERDGFTTFERLVDGDGLEDLRRAYDRILAGEVDCGEDDRRLGGITRQVMVPSRHDRSIQQNPAFVNAQRIASELLGQDADYAFDMMIFKPAGHPEETPWHQDMAYARQPFMPAGTVPVNFTVQVWIALDDADEENGCMHFVPGRHREPMPPHHVASGDEADEGRLLAITDPASWLDLRAAVACPVPAGGATAHIEGTPHYTPPNRSHRQRRAYIVNFRDPTRSYPPAT